MLKRIVKWNEERDNMKFNHFNETRMLAEELFEFCGYKRSLAKKLALQFAENHASLEVYENNFSNNTENEKSDLADAAGDLIFIATGTIAKLGFDPDEVMTRICDHNDAKGKKKDAYGKILKDKTFVEPKHT